MAVEGKNRHYHWDAIHLRHWIETGRQAKLEEETRQLIQELIQKTPEAISQVSQQLPGNFPSWISDSIFDGLIKASARLKSA